MKRKFFQRTYLIVLSVILIALLFFVILFLIYMGRRDRSLAEYNFELEARLIRETFEQTWRDCSEEMVSALQQGYVEECLQQGVHIGFYQGRNPIATAIPERLIISTLLGQVDLVSDLQNGMERWYIIGQSVCNGKYTLIYARECTEEQEEVFVAARYFADVFFVVAALLSAIVYGILKKLFYPLERLQKTTTRISCGDLTARADASSEDELGLLAKDFNAMTEKLIHQMHEMKRAVEQKQRMLDNLAHEMRTPLAVIHGYAEYIRGSNIPKQEQIESSECIMKEVMRLQNVSENLLDSAFIRENRIDPKPQSAKKLLSATVERLSPYARQRNVELLCEGGDAVFAGDKNLLEILFSNLTENAIRACRNGGRVTLRVDEAPDAAILTVEDNGVGMTAEQLTHILEPFYRTDKARSRRDGGTGLGLALCDQIVRAHGTSMKFTSEVGKGTKIGIRFRKIDDSLTTP